MGMYDYIRCKYPLPIEGANQKTYQTKDTPMQNLDIYEITEDGSLFEMDYINGELIYAFEILDFSGDINFYDLEKNKLWTEFKATFENGKLINLKVVSDNEVVK